MLQVKLLIEIIMVFLKNFMGNYIYGKVKYFVVKIKLSSIYYCGFIEIPLIKVYFFSKISLFKYKQVNCYDVMSSIMELLLLSFLFIWQDQIFILYIQILFLHYLKAIFWIYVYPSKSVRSKLFFLNILFIWS